MIVALHLVLSGCRWEQRSAMNLVFAGFRHLPVKGNSESLSGFLLGLPNSPLWPPVPPQEQLQC